MNGGITMTVSAEQNHATKRVDPAPKPRFGGILSRAARALNPIMLPLAGKRWNPIFAVAEHRGRKSGRQYVTPVAARRVDDGFVISLAFGAQVEWYRNLVAAQGGTIRWRGRAYPVGVPERIEMATALPAFMLIQRLALRIARVDGYVRVRDAEPGSA
jgi:deazaflavin-dependent oxidoreductase (nitroreductase family)